MGKALIPAETLSAGNPNRQPNESAAYRAARNALLVQEIEARRACEAAAEARRALPPGGEVTGTYRFEGANGPAGLADLFDGHDALIVYSFMYGPERAGICPMCTSFMNTWAAKAPMLRERAGIAFVARSPWVRIAGLQAERGWERLPLYSDTDGAFTRDYVDADCADIPGLAVFRRGDGILRHFWSAEMTADMADPGQDPRGAPELDPLWLMLDLTPGGRGSDCYPSVSP